MEILLQLPDDIGERLLAHRADLPRWILECLAAESYRTEILTSAEVQRMLGFKTRWETDAFLKKEEAYLRYTQKDLQNEIETFRRLR